MNNKERTNHHFDYSINYIENLTGLELSLIEKTRLREILEDTVRRYDEVQGIESSFSISFETISIFLQDYYGIPINQFNLVFLNWDRCKFLKEQGYDGYREFWRKRQEEAHLP